MTAQERDSGSLADMLIRAHVFGIPAPLPASPPVAPDAYAIQRRVFSGRHNAPVTAWKLGLTSEGSRAAMGSADPVAGRLAANAILVNGSEIPAFGAEIYAEAELVFEFGKDLPPRGKRYEPEEVAVTITGIYPGIELATTRFTSSELALGNLIADNCLGHGLVLGERFSDRWNDGFANMNVELERAGETPVEGSTATVMGSPLLAATWLANWLAVEEDGLKRGQLLASGSCTGITRVFPGDVVTARFPGWGEARVTLLR